MKKNKRKEVAVVSVDNEKKLSTVIAQMLNSKNVIDWKIDSAFDKLGDQKFTLVFICEPEEDDFHEHDF